MLISRRLTAHAIAPAPFGVKRDMQDHARLIIQMVAGRPANATVNDRAASITARENLVAAHLSWILREDPRVSPKAQASEDRATEGVARCLQALAEFASAHSVPVDAPSLAEVVPDVAERATELTDGAELQGTTAEGHPLYESIPATRSAKLQQYLGRLDAPSRTNLERHLNDPAVSSTAICAALRAHGFTIGTTSVKDHRRRAAASIRHTVGDGAQRLANGLPL